MANKAKNQYVKTYEEACKKEGVDPVQNLPFPKPKTGDQKALNAAAKLFVIARAINKQDNDGKEWKPDWTNSREWKHYPWFNLSSGSGLSCGDYGGGRSHSYVGSRLCFKTEEGAEYAGRTFIKEYEDYFLIN
jgi:hypothetical protein